AARTADAEVQRMAANAEYAGEPQPYRLNEEEDLDEDADELDDAEAAEKRR
ncbi:MAG TPA: ribosome-binding factor A, partial [Micromonosporaceae bacterium]|nr:ribosome-binding factor A [Micromonosporaceae bacterium]